MDQTAKLNGKIHHTLTNAMITTAGYNNDGYQRDSLQGKNTI